MTVREGDPGRLCDGVGLESRGVGETRGGGCVSGWGRSERDGPVRCGEWVGCVQCVLMDVVLVVEVASWKSYIQGARWRRGRYVEEEA